MTLFKNVKQLIQRDMFVITVLEAGLVCQSQPCHWIEVTHTHRLGTDSRQTCSSAHNGSMITGASTVIYIRKCLYVYLSVYVLLSHFKTHWDALWHKVAFWSREGSKTIIFGKTPKMWKRCTKYIIFSRFGQISRPFRNWFGCPLAWNCIFSPSKVLKQQYLGN